MTIKAIKILSYLILSYDTISLTHAGIPPQSPTPIWQIPSDEMSFAYHQDGMTVFHGNMTLSGTLTLSWYRDDKWQLSAIFSPDKASRQKLPVIYDDYYQNDIEIELNRIPLDKPQNTANKNSQAIYQALSRQRLSLIKPYFVLPPKPTWDEDDETDVTIAHDYPATITISEFGTSVECDFRYYYATATQIIPPKPKQKGKAIEAGEGC